VTAVGIVSAVVGNDEGGKGRTRVQDIKLTAETINRIRSNSCQPVTNTQRGESDSRIYIRGTG